MIHSALALFAQSTRIPTSARSIGFCVIWVCISSSSSSDLVGGVNVLGDDAENDALEHLEHSFRCPGFLELGEAVGDPRGESFAGAGLAVAATHVRFACSR